MLSLLYVVVRALARLFVAAGHDDGSKDLEILVLRHQLRVLQRKTGPPKLRLHERQGTPKSGRFTLSVAVGGVANPSVAFAAREPEAGLSCPPDWC